MPQFVAAIPAILGSAATAAGSGASALGATSLGAGLASAGASLTSFAGSLAGVGGAAAGGGSLVSSILGGTATAFSALASLRGADQQAGAYRSQAADAMLEATNEEIRGQQREVGLKAEYNARAGDISTAYAAAGIDLSYGAAENARSRAGTKLDQELTIDRATTDMRKSRLVSRAGSYLTMAREARASGVLQAAATAAGGLLRLEERGFVPALKAKV